MSGFDLKYVDIKDSFYKEAVVIRKELFFKNMKNSSDLIQDNFEENGIHLVCLKENEVVGTGRLNIESKTSVISQMAIISAYQNQGVGSELVKELIKYSKGKELFKIKLSARETALAFYKKFGFVAVGDKYPSQKTGIIHQQMELKID